MKHIFQINSIIVASIAMFLALQSCKDPNPLGDYKGTPFSDSKYNGGAQKLPGKLQCEYFDRGGEGIAYHETDTVNSGSGGLNKVDGSYLNSFRINEAVDISYTKFWDPAVDNSPYNLVETKPKQLYVGWTAPGEWIKYTVDVQETGTYELGLMYTANKDAKIGLAINDKMVAKTIEVPSTFVAADSLAWRQWHHWNYLDKMVKLPLEKGLQTVTLHTVEKGNMNYDFIDFKLVE